MSKPRIISHAYNLAYYTPKLWEKIMLFFAPVEVSDQQGIVITYKSFWNRLYIVDVRQETHIDGHTDDKPSDGGVNTPWMN